MMNTWKSKICQFLCSRPSCAPAGLFVVCVSDRLMDWLTYRFALVHAQMVVFDRSVIALRHLIALSWGSRHLTLTQSNNASGHRHSAFLVACTRLYNPLCPSVRRLVGHILLFFMIFFLWPHCSCSSDLKHGCCPPARDIGSRVSGLVYKNTVFWSEAQQSYFSANFQAQAFLTYSYLCSFENSLSET